MVEHNGGDNHRVLKKIMHSALEDVCHLYLYYYTIYQEESPPAQITTRQAPAAKNSKFLNCKISPWIFRNPGKDSDHRDGTGEEEGSL